MQEAFAKYFAVHILKIKQRASINLAFRCFLFVFSCGLQDFNFYVICEPQSIWRKFLVLSWLYNKQMVKLENKLKGSLDPIQSASPSVKIQIMGQESLLEVVNKILKSLLTSPSNVLPYYLWLQSNPLGQRRVLLMFRVFLSKHINVFLKSFLIKWEIEYTCLRNPENKRCT